MPGNFIICRADIAASHSSLRMGASTFPSPLRLIVGRRLGPVRVVVDVYAIFHLAFQHIIALSEEFPIPVLDLYCPALHAPGERLQHVES